MRQSWGGPWIWLRVGAKTLAIGLWTIIVMALLVLARAPSFLAAGRAPAWRAAARRHAMGIWARVSNRILGMRVIVLGPHPPPGALLVANHLSYVDILALGAVVPVVFVSKAGVRRWPLWGAAAKLGGTVFVDRSRARDALPALRQIRKALDRGDRVLIFPEATSTRGDTILPFKPALLDAASATGRPVYWATLSYHTPAHEASAQDRVCWSGNIGFVPHALGLLALRGFRCVLQFGNDPLVSGDRKALARMLRGAMLRHHRGSHSPGAPDKNGEPATLDPYNPRRTGRRTRGYRRIAHAAIVPARKGPTKGP